jgi:hypothetical protein
MMKITGRHAWHKLIVLQPIVQLKKPNLFSVEHNFIEDVPFSVERCV